MWDVEVDVAVIGAGVAGLATAIAAEEAGGEVLVVDVLAPTRDYASPVALRQRVGTLRHQLLPQTMDVETDEYFAALTEGLVMDQAPDVTVPLRSARNLSKEEVNGRVVEPFIGSRLNGWAEKCVTSPYGLMHTTLRHRPTTKMRSNGESIEVLSVGAIDWAPGSGAAELQQWLLEQTRHREIDVRAATGLQRIVFEEGVLMGVVLDTADGPLAVRTRVGVTMSPAEQEAAPNVADSAAIGHRLQVCLVGRIASRFARVELLDTEPSTIRPTCTGSRRQVREGMHEARQPALEGWRCGKVHGYPTFGQ
jgi:hypothetical protein